MTLDKFIKCECGKKKKVAWIGKTEFKRGDTTFCVGLSKCSRCSIKQQHYSGNIEDIAAFISYSENEFVIDNR